LSRHQQVREILEAAAGASTATYDGHGRFWNLPLTQLRTVKIYGVAMLGIVSARSPSTQTAESEHTCHSMAAAATPRPGAGSASGLVRGLRGQFPFDGTQFPRLPWGGSVVAETDISFIEQWIDDGAPAEDEDPASAAADHQAHRAALAAGTVEHAAFAGSVNELVADPGRLRVRKNINFLSAQELQRLRDAIATMRSFDQYYLDERSFAFWARIHAMQCQHGWEEFLTWHRAYLYFFELQLRDADPTGTVTLPYWDWAADADNLVASLNDMGDATNDNGIVPAAYRCWIDDAAIQRLTAGGMVSAETLAKLRAVIGADPQSSGARFFKLAGLNYANDPATKAIVAELERVNPLFHWKRWPGGNKGIIFEAYPTEDDVKRILTTTNFFKFASGPTNDQYFGALENIHNLIHNFSGGANPYSQVSPDEPPYGDMVSPGTTAFDPIFWGHHANVDRIWSQWQANNPNVGPDNPSTVLAPWHMTVAETASLAALGYEYMMDTRVFPTNRNTPIVKFLSAPVGIHPAILVGHRRAEIRLHAVQFVPRVGFHIRVFLNSPDASIKAPTRGNDHYVGQVNMFTGPCIGGPEHCAVPEAKTVWFDHRPRHRKTPSSFRIDASDAVQKLAAAGTTDFQVNLVVMNTDGTPATDALLIDGVSLNFIQ
jgi:tyrosinase